jgi:hypothetical protein
MKTERVREYGVPAAVLAGVLLAVAPVPTMIVDSRLINAVYLLPLLLLAAGVLTQGARTRRDIAGDIGYWMTLTGVVVSIIGSVLEAVFAPSMLAEWNLAGGIVFFVGVYFLLFGGLFLGVGLLRTSQLSRAGPLLLVLSFPLAVIGLRWFNAIGLQDFNWVPVAVPYGLAWLLLGIDLQKRGQQRNQNTEEVHSAS